MEESKDFQIILYYKYVHLDDPEAEKLKQKELCDKLGLKGRIIVATEGINGTIEGTTENTEKYIEEMSKDIRFETMHWKRSVSNGNSFPKLSVKTRKEIVSLHLDDMIKDGYENVCDVDPNVITGIHLKPEELHEWIMENKTASEQGFGEPREFYIVDMRNAYEFKVGHFENSILPPMENFRDLPKVVEQIKHLKDKTVLTVCTGGVRCEKASGFLITQGFTDVYQLDGGIVSYMEKYPNEDFKGKLYVFDGRVSMGFHTDDPKHEIIAKCDCCGETSENYVNCSNPVCHRHFLACLKCVDSTDGQVVCPLGCVLSRHGRKISPVEAGLV